MKECWGMKARSGSGDDILTYGGEEDFNYSYTNNRKT